MFPTTILWFLVALFSGMVPEKTAEQVAKEAGATCERGCLVGSVDGWVYEFSREDVVLAARTAHCEVETVIGTADADAAMWQLLSGFYRRHLVGRVETFGFFTTHYSGCSGRKWSSRGTHYNARITPRADANLQLRWRDIPQRTRDYVRSFFRNEIPNRMPGVVFTLTHGFERHADPSWIGPSYAENHGPGSFNAYWKSKETIWWTTATVRLVPPTGVSAEGQPHQPTTHQSSP